MHGFMVDSNCLARETIRFHCSNNVEGVVQFERTACDICTHLTEGKAIKEGEETKRQ